jgi:hypothetical protein
MLFSVTPSLDGNLNSYSMQQYKFEIVVLITPFYPSVKIPQLCFVPSIPAGFGFTGGDRDDVAQHCVDDVMSQIFTITNSAMKSKL